MPEIITKTRKNNISRRQRTECFLAALGDFLVASRKYQHKKTTDSGDKKRED